MGLIKLTFERHRYNIHITAERVTSGAQDVAEPAIAQGEFNQTGAT